MLHAAEIFHDCSRNQLSTSAAEIWNPYLERESQDHDDDQHDDRRRRPVPFVWGIIVVYHWSPSERRRTDHGLASPRRLPHGRPRKHQDDGERNDDEKYLDGDWRVFAPFDAFQPTRRPARCLFHDRLHLVVRRPEADKHAYAGGDTSGVTGGELCGKHAGRDGRSNCRCQPLPIVQLIFVAEL
jgi:hypothetical protein